MKAAEIKKTGAPSHVFTLGPAAFTDSWTNRPKEPIRIGMRRASADEFLAASNTAVLKTDEHFPKLSHDDRIWDMTYQVIYIHILLGWILVHPEDVTRPYWPADDGSRWFAFETSGAGAASNRFTREGIERLHSELEVLSVKGSVTWAEADDADLGAMADAIKAGTFFPSISIGDGVTTADEAEANRASIERQIRQLLGYAMQLHSTGLSARPGPPAPEARKPGAPPPAPKVEAEKRPTTFALR